MEAVISLLILQCGFSWLDLKYGIIEVRYGFPVNLLSPQLWKFVHLICLRFLEKTRADLGLFLLLAADCQDQVQGIAASF